jgi:flagellar motor switch/type III secretory pathway protein FliN
MSSPPRSVPLLWLGDERRERLRVRLEQQLQRWSQRWSTAREELLVEVPEVHVESYENAMSGAWASAVVVRSSGVELVDVLWSGRVMQSLLGGSARSAGDFGFSSRIVADDVSQDALADLGRHIHAGSRFSATEASCATPSVTDALARARAQRAIVACVTVGAASARMLIAMHPELVEQLAPPSKRTVAPAPERRRNAIGPESVGVQAMLGSAELTLGELAELAIGDVILLDHELNQPVRLESANAQYIASAHLGRSGSNLAVTITR